MKLYHLPLNLQQGFIHTGKPNVCNTICAIYTRAKKLIVIRPEYRDLQDQILSLAMKETRQQFPNVIYGDGFGADTWDHRIFPQQEHGPFSLVWEIPTSQISDLLVTALEGGSNYWYHLPDLNMVPEMDTPGYETLSEAERIFKALMDGVTIPVHDIETDEALGALSVKGMREALQQMVQAHPHKLWAIIEQSYDADDADTFLQYAVMGEIVYQ